VVVVCHSCENEIAKETHTPILKEKVAHEKSSFKTPIYFFSGLILIVLAIGWSKYNDSKHDDFVKDSIYALQVDDVLIIKNEGEYSFVKIDSIGENEYYFRASNYSFDQDPTASDYYDGVAKYIDFYDNDLYVITPTELDSINVKGNLNIFEE
jgi:hypothetical protein